MSMLRALGSGVAGAIALNVLHESARQVIPHAPRVDAIGKRAIAKPMRAAGLQPPRGRALYATALAGDVISNSLYYSLIGVGTRRQAWTRGALLGLLGGLGAVFLPPLLGLGRQPNQRTPFTQILTVLWYTFGGLVAAATAQAIEADDGR